MKCIRFFVFSVSLFIVLALSSLSCSALDIQSYESIINKEQLEDGVKESALNYFTSFTSIDNVTIEKLIPIINDSDTISYEVEFFSNGSPNGYCIIEYINSDFNIKLINTSKGVKGIYTTILDNAKSKCKSIPSYKTSKYLYELADLSYFVLVTNEKNESYFIDSNGTISYDTNIICRATNYSSYSSIFIYPSSWRSSSYKIDNSSIINLEKYNYRSRLLTEKYVENITLKYCCAIQALLQISYMEQLTSYNSLDIVLSYNYLWKNANVKIYKTENNIDYGGCTLKQASNSLVKFAKSKGYSKSTSEFKTKPSVSWLKNNLKNNKPIIMGYNIKVNGEVGGHSISVLGYDRAKEISSGKSYNYLKIYDSWTNGVCFLNYTTVDFIDCWAASFNIKK